MIPFNDFKKLDLRVGKILSAENIEGSEKLLRMEVDIGDERRQLVAGLGKQYLPDALAGREIILIANLEPRSIMGHDSQGMLLAADCESQPVLLIPEREVPPGTIVR